MSYFVTFNYRILSSQSLDSILRTITPTDFPPKDLEMLDFIQSMIKIRTLLARGESNSYTLLEIKEFLEGELGYAPSLVSYVLSVFNTILEYPALKVTTKIKETYGTTQTARIKIIGPQIEEESLKMALKEAVRNKTVMLMNTSSSIVSPVSYNILNIPNTINDQKHLNKFIRNQIYAILDKQKNSVLFKTLYFNSFYFPPYPSPSLTSFSSADHPDQSNFWYTAPDATDGVSF